MLCHFQATVRNLGKYTHLLSCEELALVEKFDTTLMSVQ